MTKTLMCETGIITDMLIADTFFKRFMGYMFRKKPHHRAILIKPCNSIHTFFMKFNIDVLFVNEEMEVVKKVDNLKAGKVIGPVKGAVMVIEGKAGLFQSITSGNIISM